MHRIFLHTQKKFLTNTVIAFFDNNYNIIIKKSSVLRCLIILSIIIFKRYQKELTSFF